MNPSRPGLRVLGLLFCLLVPGASSAAAGSVAAVSAHAGYAYYQVGKLDAPRPGATEPALLLMGGGAWPHPAFAWFAASGGHGHFLILRASGADDLQRELYEEVGGVASVQTLVFHDRAAASDPRVLAIVRAADGIFIAGGDQAKYVRFWKGTPLNELLDRHVALGKPLGGSSAGLAILGRYGYGALDGGSITSPEALSDPLGPAVTLVGDFLHLPHLQHIITDTHFHARQRLGRLIAFVARLRHEGHPDVIGLGVDQDTALCVEADGRGRVVSRNGGFAWLVQPDGLPVHIAPGKPLDYEGIRVTGIGPRSRFDLRDMRVRDPAFETVADVRGGKLHLREGSSPSPPRSVP